MASEITGKISTDPNAMSVEANNPPAAEPLNQTPNQPEVSFGTGRERENPSGEVVMIPQPTVSREQEVAEKIKVLGLSQYADGSLIRGSDHKIYLIDGGIKKYIPSLKELAEYRGQAILAATDEELAQYPTRPHLAGELIRQQGDVKVFEITTNGKHHVLNLGELKAHYFGREIYNISSQEMALY